MPRIPQLSLAARKQLVRAARKTGDRVVIFLTTVLAALAAGGRSHRQVAHLLSCAPSTVSETTSRFRAEGFDGLRDRRADNGIDKVDQDFLDALRMLLYSRPTDWGWERPTWTRALLTLEMQRRQFPLISVAAMGRALRRSSARRATRSRSCSARGRTAANAVSSMSCCVCAVPAPTRSRSSTPTKWTLISTRRSASIG
jgi:transposase